VRWLERADRRAAELRIVHKRPFYEQSHPNRAKILAKSNLKLVAPAAVNRTVPPGRRPNADLRTREHLTETEIERLIAAAKDNRHGHRDATMVLVAYRHGLRAAELVDLRCDQIDFRTATLHVRRVKKGTPSTQILDEMRALRGDLAAALTRRNIPFVFVTGYGRQALPESFGQSRMLTKPFTREQLLQTAARLVRPLPVGLRLHKDREPGS
jgi:integrase